MPSLSWQSDAWTVISVGRTQGASLQGVPWIGERPDGLEAEDEKDLVNSGQEPSGTFLTVSGAHPFQHQGHQPQGSFSEARASQGLDVKRFWDSKPQNPKGASAV